MQKPRTSGFEPDWGLYLRSVPAERVEAMAMRRLDREKENAPQYSRYLQVTIPNRRHTLVRPCATLYSIFQKQRLSFFESAANRSVGSVA